MSAHLTAIGNLLITLAIGLAASSANCAEVSDCLSQSNGAFIVNSSAKCASVLARDGALKGQLTAAIGAMNTRGTRPTHGAQGFSTKSTSLKRLEYVNRMGDFSPKQPNAYYGQVSK